MHKQREKIKRDTQMMESKHIQEPVYLPGAFEETKPNPKKVHARLQKDATGSTRVDPNRMTTTL